MYRLIETKNHGREFQIHWNITTVTIEDEGGTREEEQFDYVTVTDFNIETLQSLGVPQFIIDEVGVVASPNKVKYVVLPASQNYNDIMTTINAQRGYSSQRLGTERYATADIEQFKATDEKYYVPIWYDIQDLPIFDGLTFAERTAFTYASELLHPMWTANEVVIVGDIRWSEGIYYEAVVGHTCRANNRPPSNNWKIWEKEFIKNCKNELKFYEELLVVNTEDLKKLEKELKELE